MRYPLTLELGPSRRLAILIAAIHSIAAIAFLASSFSHPVRIGVSFALGVSLFFALREERAKAGSFVVLEPTGKFRFGGRGGTELGVPERGCVDFGWAVWIQWRAEPDDPETSSRRRRALMILPDSIGPENWRALRIWMRHVALPSGANGGATDMRR